MPPLQHLSSAQRHSLSQTDRLGLQLANRLQQHPLPAEVQERLRAAREQALAAALNARTPTQQPSRWQALRERLRLAPNSWWHALGATTAVVTFTLSFWLFQDFQSTHMANEMAKADALLLTDDLPPEAYTDQGFMQFLRNSPSTNTE